MNSKIIFWINDDLVQIGLTKILQEKYNFENYAILNITEKQKQFFQKQRLVKFNKIWYYHDHIHKTSKTPDLAYLKSIEEKYKINLWLLASNERFFSEFNKFYKFSQNEILSILEQECKLFENIIDKVQPDFFLAAVTTLHHDHLFYEICKAKGVKVLMIKPSFLLGKFIISSETDTIENIQSSTSYHFSSLTELQNYLKKYSSNIQAKRNLNEFQSSKRDYLQAALQFLFSANSNPKTHYTYYGRSKFAVLKNMIVYTIKRRYRKNFINKNLIYDFENKKPFIYFPLHIEQERGLLIDAPFYTNQIELIRNIAKSLPVGYDLYVKEHPTQVLRGWRSISDYKQIMDLPNVTLIHPSIKSEDIIKKSSLVVTIGGTSGLEAAFYGKPSIIFTDQEYSILPSVHKIKTTNELPNAIKTSLKKQLRISDLNNYINLIESNSFEFDFHRLSMEFDNYFHLGGFLADVKIPINKMKSFLEQNNGDYEKLAAEFVKKIQKYEHQKSL